MANENILTPTEKMTVSLRNVITEVWKSASAAFATKQEVGVDYATEAECRAIVTGYGQSGSSSSSSSE